MIHWKRSILGLAFVLAFALTYYFLGGDLAAKVKHEEPIENRNSFDKLSREFIDAVYSGDQGAIENQLAKGTSYVKSPDGSSIIRFDDGKTLVEGYMATDKNLVSMHQKWHTSEDNGAYLSSMEVYVKGDSWPLTWNIYFIEENRTWKVYMVENGI